MKLLFSRTDTRAASTDRVVLTAKSAAGFRTFRAARLLSTLLFTALLGCSSGLSITGGSIPIGTIRLRGVVIRADNITQVVPNTPSSLQLDGNLSRATGNDTGRFDYGFIPGGNFTYTIPPPYGSESGKLWQWQFTLLGKLDGSPLGVPSVDSTNAQLVATVWPRGFDPATVSSVTLAPNGIRMRVGETVRFVATPLDKNAQAIALAPSLLLEGDIGPLTVDGTFQARKPGVGRLTAWMAGQSLTVEIRVLASDVVLPDQPGPLLPGDPGTNPTNPNDPNTTTPQNGGRTP
jgi:hypothetical protein